MERRGGECVIKILLLKGKKKMYFTDSGDPQSTVIQLVWFPAQGLFAGLDLATEINILVQ